MELPRFVALKSTINDKYLRYVNEDGPLHGFLQVNGEELVTPFTKFEVVKAKCGDGLVNMRSCYNNKFWLKASPIFNWIVVGADEREEDETKWSCTLFKPIIHNLHGGVKIVSFHHVQLDHSVFVERNGPSHDSCLLVAPTKPKGAYCDVYTIIDWDGMCILPKYVAFKGDNGKYLRPQKIKGHEYKEYLQFEAEKLGDSHVGNAIFFNRHGDIKIQSDVLIGGDVWKRNSDDWILANSNFPIIPPFVSGFGPSHVIPDHSKIPDDLPFGPSPVIPDHPKIPGDLPFGPGPVLPNPIPSDLPFPHGPGPIIPDHPNIPGDLPFIPGPVIPDHPKIPGDLPFGPGPVIPDHPKIPCDLPFGPGPVIPDHPKIPGDLPFGPGPVIPDHPKIPGDLPFGPGPVIPDHPKIPGYLPFGPGPVIPDHPKIPGDLPFGPGPVIPDHPNIPGDLPFGPGPVIPDHPKIPGDLPFGPGPVIPDHPKIPGDLPFGPGPVIPDHPKIPGDLPFGPGPVIPDHPKIPGDLPFGPSPVIPDHPNIPGDLPFGPGPVIPDHPKIPGDLPFGPGPVIPDHPKIPGDLPFGPGPVIPDHPKISGDLPFGPGPVIPDHPKIPGDLPFGPGPVIPDHPNIPGDLPFGPGPVIPDHPKIPDDLPFVPGPVIPDHPKIPSDLPFGPGPVLPIPIPCDLPFPHGRGPVLPIPIPIFPEDSLFWPEKVANNIVALRNLGNNQYCKRYTTNDFTSCLSAIDTSISEYSRIEVEELVTSRRIKTINFFLKDGRIYDHVDIIIATEEVVNKTNEPIIEDVKFSYPDTRSRCWNSSVSSKLYDLTTMQAENPFVVDGKIEIPNEEFRGSYRWGETQTSTTVVETMHKVSVPPMCKVRVTLTATKASCDVPFSYSQQDILTNGHQVTQSMDDGIYTGINYFCFGYETLEENL